MQYGVGRLSSIKMNDGMPIAYMSDGIQTEHAPLPPSLTLSPPSPHPPLTSFPPSSLPHFILLLPPSPHPPSLVSSSLTPSLHSSPHPPSLRHLILPHSLTSSSLTPSPHPPSLPHIILPHSLTSSSLTPSPSPHPSSLPHLILQISSLSCSSNWARGSWSTTLRNISTSPGGNLTCGTVIQMH